MNDQPDFPRLYNPPKEKKAQPKNYAAMRYFSEGKIDNEKWDDMLEHATTEEMQAVRKRLCGVVANKIKQYLDSWLISARNTPDGQMIPENNDVLEAYRSFGDDNPDPRTANAFQHLCIKMIDSLRLAHKEESVDWVAHPQTSLMLYDPDNVDPAARNTWGRLSSIEVMLRTMLTNRTRNSHVGELYTLVERLDHLCYRIDNMDKPDHTPPSGEKGTHGRGAG